MSIRNVEQGIQLIQRGSLEEGARLLRIAIKDPQLSGEIQATALIWLAETSPDPQFKLQCYQQALNVNPGNQAATERLSILLASQLPAQPARPPETSSPPPNPPGMPAPPPSLPGMPNQSAPMPSSFSAQAMPGAAPAGSGYTPQRTRLARTPLVVGILSASRRAGSAFFVTREGLLATTRTVTSGDEYVDVHLSSTQVVPGRVVRSFPDVDLALVQSDVQLQEIYPPTQSPTVADNTPVAAYMASGDILRSVRRATRHEAGGAYWIPTTIQQVLDGGGAPLLDPQTNLLLGMLTRNHSRTTGYCYALHSHEIFRRIDQYQHEISSAQAQINSLTYCPACGHVSRAAAFGAFYCEYCGATLPFAIEQPMRRFIPATAALYGEAMSRACRSCGSTIGYYNGVCLRCGTEQDNGPLAQPRLRR